MTSSRVSTAGRLSSSLVRIWEKIFHSWCSEHFDEEELRGGGGLADGFGLPVFDGFDVQDVVAQLLLGDAAGSHAQNSWTRRIWR